MNFGQFPHLEFFSNNVSACNHALRHFSYWGTYVWICLTSVHRRSCVHHYETWYVMNTVHMCDNAQLISQNGFAWHRPTVVQQLLQVKEGAYEIKLKDFAFLSVRRYFVFSLCWSWRHLVIWLSLDAMCLSFLKWFLKYFW